MVKTGGGTSYAGAIKRTHNEWSWQRRLLREKLFSGRPVQLGPLID